MTTLDSFAPAGAPFYDSQTISALVTDNLRRIMVDETAGRITTQEAIDRAVVVHAVAMECRADAGLVARCVWCEWPIEGEPWRNSRPWAQDPYCSSDCAMKHADAAGSQAAWCVKGPNPYGYIPPRMAGHRSPTADPSERGAA